MFIKSPSFYFFIYIKMDYETLQSVCKERMSKQDKLTLWRDYRDYLEPDQVKEFLSYVETEIENWNYYEPSTYLYDWFTWCQNYDWFNDYENEQFHSMYMEPFEEEFGEEEWFDYSDAQEILRDLMYDMDKYDADIEHFDKDYNFYLLTDPCKTYELYDEQIPFVQYKHKYLKSLIASQNWTANSTSMKELIRSGWYNGLGICIMLNISLFDMINIMKAKKLTVKSWTKIYMFNPYIWTWWDTTELTNDWSFRLNLNEIGFGVDWARHGCRGYTPEDTYWWYHPAFNDNRVTFRSLKK